MGFVGKMAVGALAIGMMAGCGESKGPSGSGGAAGGSGSGGVGVGGGVSGSGGVGGGGGVSGSAGGSGQAGVSGGAGTSGNGGASASGSGGTSGSSSEYFISAIVDGVPVRAETNVQALWFQGLTEGQLGLEGSTADQRFDFVVGNYVSSNSCNYLVLAPVPAVQGLGAGSYVEGGSCDMTLAAAAPNVGDFLEGTFSAVVGTFSDSPLLTLTDGRFRAPRVADRLP